MASYIFHFQSTEIFILNKKIEILTFGVEPLKKPPKVYSKENQGLTACPLHWCCYGYIPVLPNSSLM